MAEEPTDWSVQVTLDRKALVEEITKLVQILALQRKAVIVFASSGEEASVKAKEHLQRYPGIPLGYIKALHPRRLPT
jgi:hypothetical protein